MIVEHRNANPRIKAKALALTRIHGALEALNLNKKDKTCDLLGCTTQEYADHLGPEVMRLSEAKKQIDHIWPLSIYDLTVEAEKFKAFNWRNTRLISASENREKHAKPPSKQLALTVPMELWPDGWGVSDLHD